MAEPTNVGEFSINATVHQKPLAMASLNFQYLMREILNSRRSTLNTGKKIHLQNGIKIHFLKPTHSFRSRRLKRILPKNG
jgi:hypothetical protein